MELILPIPVRVLGLETINRDNLLYIKKHVQQKPRIALLFMRGVAK